MHHVELARRAQRDLRPLRRQAIWPALERALTQELTADPPPENLDIKALAGAAPWLRLRVENYRLLYRPLTAEELAELRASGVRSDAAAGYLIQRVVHRRDLDAAVSTL